MSESDRARPARPSKSHAGAGWVIGLDVGGTKIAGGLVDLDHGRLVARRRVATRPERGGAGVLQSVRAMAETLVGEAASRDRQVCGIGVGVAELVGRGGEITSGYTIQWQGMPVARLLSDLAPASVHADVRAAALAEARFGAGRPYEIFLYVTVGTGASVCLVNEGMPYTGARGGALVLGGNASSLEPGQVGRPPRSLLEVYVGGPALVSRYRAGGGARQVSRAEEVYAAATAGDSTAAEVLRTAGEALGAGIGDAVNLLDPEAIVVGGGVGLAGGLYWSSFVSTTRAYVWSDAARDLPILPATLGADAGVIGAAVSWARQRTRPGDVCRQQVERTSEEGQ